MADKVKEELESYGFEMSTLPEKHNSDSFGGLAPPAVAVGICFPFS